MIQVYYTKIDSPVGPLLVTLEEGQLTNVCFSNQKRTVDVQPEWVESKRHFKTIAKQLAEYFQGKRRAFDIPIRLKGTDFQLSVWKQLSKITYGTTVTYGDIAKRIKNPKAVRAVGLANGQNPVPIIVPCHRVIGANGKLTGFGGGLENKAHLLQIESSPRHEWRGLEVAELAKSFGWSSNSPKAYAASATILPEVHAIPPLLPGVPGRGGEKCIGFV